MNAVPTFRFTTGGQLHALAAVRAMGCGSGRFEPHSATGESWYMDQPGLHVAAAATPANVDACRAPARGHVAA